MEHYFTDNPKSEFVRERFDVEILGQKLSVNSGSGIFSLKNIDFGTKLLIENARIPSSGHSKAVPGKPSGISVLDLGCGYGIVGIAIKLKYPEINVTMIDINERAVKLARENCAKNNAECEILKSDIFSSPEIQKRKFDIILTNPPFSAGKKVCIEIIRQSLDHLNHGGSLQLVAPHNKGGESLKKIMLATFNNVGELAKKKGYRVYISMKK